VTGAEAIALSRRRGVTLGVFLGKLRVYPDGEPDESLVRLLRDNKQAVMDAVLAAETESDRWRRVLAEKTQTITQLRGLTRLGAEREAFQHVVIEFLNWTHPNADPTCCAHCGGYLMISLPFLLIAVKFWGGLLAIGAGLALGREGPSVQMGASLAHLVGKTFHRGWPDCRVDRGWGWRWSCHCVQRRSESAPIAGAVFVLEELVQRLEHRIAIAEPVEVCLARPLRPEECRSHAPAANSGGPIRRRRRTPWRNRRERT
jgi:hypothetical protein